MRHWCSLALIVCAIAAPAAQSGPAVTLTPGTPSAAALAAGQTHTYRVTLEAGDFAVVAIRGTMYLPVVMVTTPAGSALPQSPWRDLAIVADAPGVYVVRVVPNPGTAPPGPYQIAVELRRPATATDRTRAAAYRELCDGWSFESGTDVGARSKAVDKYTSALASFRDIDDRAGQLLALQGLGRSHSLLDTDPAESRRFFSDALSVARAVGSRSQEADALRSLAATYRTPAERRTAIDYNAQALAIYEALGDVRGQAIILNNRARAYVDLGEYALALSDYNRAIGLARDANDLTNVARVYANRGAAQAAMGDLPEALESFQLALPASRSAGSTDLELMATNNLGIAYKQLGDYRRALEAYQQALAVYRRRGDAIAEAQVLNNIGNVQQNLAENQASLDSYQAALAIARRLQQRGLEAMVLNNMGATYSQMGAYQRALDHHQEAQTIRHTLGDRSGEASALSRAGVALHQLGNLEKAAESLNAALTMRRQLNEATNAADTMLTLAAVERDRGNLDQARTTLEAALGVTEGLRARIADAGLRASYIARVEDTYASYVDVLMRLHERTPAAGHDREALQAAERSRARVLLESLAEAGANLREGVDPALLADEKAHQRKLDAASAQLSRLLSSAAAERDVAAARQALDAADRDYQQIRSRIRTTSPKYGALTQPEPLTVDRIQREVLDADTVLLEFALGESRSWLWAVTTDGITSVPLPGREALEAASRDLYGDVIARQPKPNDADDVHASRVAAADRRLQERAATMSRLLFGGIAAQLNGVWRDKRLAIVASGALEYLPFSALPVPSPGTTTAPVSLIARHEIVEIPSASVLDTLRREAADRPAAKRGLAVLADPVFELSDPRVTRPAASVPGTMPFTSERAAERLTAVRGAALARLPFSREEASTIAALAGRIDTLSAVDFSASRSAALASALADYRIVHFATHGLIDSQRPDLSGLVLSLVNDRGVPQDGFLRLTDIYNMRLNADVVVLSACQTALGAEIRGEGLVGLTRGFMYAGAPRVVASLWQVNDFATAELMKRFYAGMLQRHLSPAAALRAAQLDLRKNPRWASPYYWAGFVLQGDWQQDPSRSR